jgi:hypothetical protein
MDSRTFVVDLVRYGAWPVSTVVLGWMFRKALMDLLGRISRVETKVLSFKTNDEVEQPRLESLLRDPHRTEQDQIGVKEPGPGAMDK